MEPQVIKMYAAREQIYPREAKGRYATWRWVCVWLTQLAFYGLPWLNWNGRQALLFDLTTRKFYIFGVVLWPQDFIYLAALLIIAAYLLFLVTAIAGRVWCGFSCPQTVYTEIFLWVERKIEGTRSARMALDRQGPSVRKTGKKVAKHLAWGAIALWTGFTFVGYFTPIQDLVHEVRTFNFGPWEWFWILFYSLATYGNAGWLREQVCKYMCPYARFQSAMFDQDTLIITYDDKRGEPRGALNKKAAKDGTQARLGDCIDCTLCVQVCPTGIDIRNGLQYECIGCAACVDACNSVMDKVERPRGLIRYSTDHAMENNFNSQQIRRRAMRPRVLIYTSILALIIVAVCTSLFLRTPLKMDVIRDRGSMGREVEDGMIENVYRLQIMNTSEQSQRFRIAVSGLPGLALITRDEVTLQPTETLGWPVRLRVPHGVGEKGSNKIQIELQSLDDPSLHVRESAVFIVPR
ncbi:cytochrome c oxidase accessory protein CcoG [Janthinobacterium psychrotolerans]|uniref:Cytochrome c oxidase accessory protein FixG n=1 Tax=Janthinobacterium psychrotolerans TaxID=1747903 RepID=A0A1A7C0Y4_9BURK|nr:cytochrome c oxidase accessory protein CcoG [Janthinobacterium psychrotolerans]OBV39606.1 cytochrome c oxidase accessory protein FixG [Janthinobacterium psychrotolerans]